MLLQFGLTSYKKGAEKCGDIPSVFTRTSAFINWIVDNVS